MEEKKEKWYHAKEAAREYGIGYSTITRAIRDGKLKTTKVSGQGRSGFVDLISETSLNEYVKTLKQRKTIITGVTELTVDDLAGELLKRINDAYERGYKDGMATAKKEIKERLKGITQI